MNGPRPPTAHAPLAPPSVRPTPRALTPSPRPTDPSSAGREGQPARQGAPGEQPRTLGANVDRRV
jgi:hypothetical protein